MKLEEKLIALRKEKGLSQLKLAEIMKVSRQAISRWEVGAAAPSTENLKYLGSLYNVSLEVLLDDNRELELGKDKQKETIVLPKQQGKKSYLAVIIIILGILIIACIYIAVIVLGESKNELPLNEIEGSEIETDREKDFNLDWR